MCFANRSMVFGAMRMLSRCKSHARADSTVLKFVSSTVQLTRPSGIRIRTACMRATISPRVERSTTSTRQTRWLDAQRLRLNSAKTWRTVASVDCVNLGSVTQRTKLELGYSGSRAQQHLLSLHSDGGLLNPIR